MFNPGSGAKAFWFTSLCDLANVSDMPLHSGTADRNGHFQSDLSGLMESKHFFMALTVSSDSLVGDNCKILQFFHSPDSFL